MNTILHTLIIDPSEIMIDRLIDLINQSEFNNNFYRAHSYSEAINIIEQKQTDLVLLNIGLRGDKTFNLIKQIKSIKPLIKVMLLTNNIDENLSNEYHQLGADMLLDKFNEFEKIPNLINDCFIKN